MKSLRSAAALIGLMALAGCQTTAAPNVEAALAQQIPPTYKAQVVAHIKRMLRDPYSVRDAEITDPTATWAGGGKHSPGVCVRLNAKNGWGAYAGMATYAVSFRNGKIDYAMPPLYSDCTKVSWRPFPEMMP